MNQDPIELKPLNLLGVSEELEKDSYGEPTARDRSTLETQSTRDSEAPSKSSKKKRKWTKRPRRKRKTFLRDVLTDTMYHNMRLPKRKASLKH